MTYQSPCREPMAFGRPSAFDPGGGDTGTSTTVQNAEPWSGIQPFLTGAGGQPGLYPLAAQQVQRPQQYFPGSTVVGFSPETEAALGFTTERALAGSPLLGAAQAEAQRTLQGDYLAEGNPYLDAVGDRLYRQIRPRVDAQFARGPAGSPGHGFSMANALGDAMAPYHFGAFESERGRMQSAMGAAPGLANADYFDAAQLAGAGQQREGLQSRILQDEINRFNFGQQEPIQRLAQYAGLLGTGVGPNNVTSTQTSRQPGTNPLFGLLGAGLSAAPWLAAL